MTTPGGAAGRRPIVNTKVVSLWVLFLPSAVLLFVFSYLPLYGALIAFKNYSPYLGVWKSPWVGLANLRDFLLNPYFWNVLRNTVLLSLLDMLFGFTAPILFALLANEIASSRYKRTVQTISYLPHFLSWVVVAGLFKQILSPTNGLVNQALGAVLNLPSVFFFIEPRFFRPLVVAAEIWKSTGYSAILYFATIAGIDRGLYEAAYIDGASRLRQAYHVTLPGMVPIILLMFLLRISGIFNVGFERIFLFQSPAVYEVSEVISVYVYRLGLQGGLYSLTSAIGLVQSTLGFILLVAANRLSQTYGKLGLY